MTFYPDGSPCDYWGRESARRLRAAGWLEGGEPFARGRVSRTFLTKLEGLLAEAWERDPFRGLHSCGLRTGCGARGYRNLFVPGDRFVYVSPELIVHYIEEHGYRPPAEFVRAVNACPEMNSRAYIEAMWRNGPTRLGGSPLKHWTWLAETDPRFETTLIRSSVAKQRAAALAACEAAVAATGVPHPLVEEGLTALREGRNPSASVRARLMKLSDRLMWARDPRCPTKHPHPGETCPRSWEASCSARAVASALAGHAGGVCEAVAEADMATGRTWKQFRKIVADAMRSAR